ncbi:7-cyano-7-deazaguanine synthase QueC [Legionella tunisiensis]|uniref:7-cyano-7-deazaguanine synthase QueC n=1 Tax=Legionella tunisiensis TaxID=1034944 RepID=UPI0002E79F81|nr:7-cyano-7-deazaguanine synthase QueC [Legionella tunisiensis]
MKKAVVLLSGGLDSTTCLAMAKAQGFACYALSFAYGQRHSVELSAARRVAAHLQVVEHRVVTLDLDQFGGSALTDETVSVPDYKGDGLIPVTYVPARNTVFLSIALGFAEVIAARDIFIGVSAIDYSGYPDCRPEFIAAFEHMANLATKAGVEGEFVKLHTPLQYLSKAETILAGKHLGVDYALTVSCYQATESGHACGRCDSCTYRRQGFKAAGIADPTLYL